MKVKPIKIIAIVVLSAALIILIVKLFMLGFPNGVLSSFKEGQRFEQNIMNLDYKNIENWTFYWNQDLGYSLKYPKNWYLINSGDATSYRTQIQVDKPDTHSEISTSDGLEIRVSQNDESLSAVEKFYLNLAQEKQEINGVTAKKYSEVSGNQTLEDLFLQKGTVTYHISIHSSSADNSAVLNNMAATFEVLR